MGRPPKRKGERLSKNRTFRVRGDLDARLHKAAKRNECSVSEEIERRLQQSFDQDDAFGGPELRSFVYIMAAAFERGGSWEAPDVPPSKWLRDPVQYGRAMISVVEQLAGWFPGDADTLALMMDSAKGRALTRIVNKRPSQ